jgi:hypothetical protein
MADIVYVAIRKRRLEQHIKILKTLANARAWIGLLAATPREFQFSF